MLTPIFLHELRYPRTPGNISPRKRKRERNLGSCNPFRTTVKLSIDHRHLTWPIMSSINCNSLLPCFPSAPVYIGGRDRRLPQQWTPLPFPPPPLIARIWRHAALPRYFSWFRWWIVKKKKKMRLTGRGQLISVGLRGDGTPFLPFSPYIGAYYPRIGVSASSSFFLFLSFSLSSPLFVRFFRNSRSIWTEHRTPAFIGACVYTRTKRPLHGRRSIYRQPRPIFLFSRWIDNVSSFADQFVSPRN